MMSSVSVPMEKAENSLRRLVWTEEAALSWGNAARCER